MFNNYILQLQNLLTDSFLESHGSLFDENKIIKFVQEGGGTWNLIIIHSISSYFSF